MKLSGKDLLQVLEGVGFVKEGLMGNHFLAKKGSRTVLIPDEEELAEKTIAVIIDQAGLTSKDVVKLLRFQKGSEPPSLEAEPETPSRGFFASAWTVKGWLAPVAGLRVLMGSMFLMSAFEKAPYLPGPFGWLKPFLEGAAQSTAMPFINGLITTLLLPNLGAFGWLQFLVELFLGVFLVMGLFTPLISFIGTFWVVFFSMIAMSLPDPFVILYAVMWTASMVLLWTTRAGRSFGIDQALAKKAGEKKEESGFWWFVGLFV